MNTKPSNPQGDNDGPNALEPQQWLDDILKKQLELAESRYTESDGRVHRLLTVALPILVATATTNYFLTQQFSGAVPGQKPQDINIDLVLALLSPMAFILIFAVAIYTLWYKVAHQYDWRISCERVNKCTKKYLGEERFNEEWRLLFRHSANSPGNFHSFR